MKGTQQYSTVLSSTQPYSAELRSSRVLKSTHEYSEVLDSTKGRRAALAAACAGPDLHADGLEYMHNNKWQNGAVSSTVLVRFSPSFCFFAVGLLLAVVLLFAHFRSPARRRATES